VYVSALEEPEAKEKYMRRLMMQLPEPNYSSAMLILDHLIRYRRYVRSLLSCNVCCCHFSVQ